MSSVSSGRGWSRGPGKPSSPRTPAQRALGTAVEVVVVVTTALVLSLLIKTFLVQAFSIPSESMEETLLIGDRVMVSKLTPDPFDLQRGDVVVFTDPGGWLEDSGPKAEKTPLIALLTFVGLLPENYGEHLIKRTIGLPGDVVACCDPKGRVTVNGVAIDEPYLGPGNVPSETRFSVKVKPGNLWVMGDNRNQSADSRYHQHINDGQVPVEDVVGKAFVTAWPLGRLGSVPAHHEVFSKVPSPK